MMARRDRPALERVNKLPDGLHDANRGVSQHQGYVLTREGLTLGEAYRCGQVSLLLLYVDPVSSHLKGIDVRGVRHDPAQAGRDHADLVPARGPFIDPVLRGQDQLVFVRNVELVHPVKKMISARLCVQTYDDLDDVFAGQLYLSAYNGLMKSLRVQRALGEGVLDIVGVRDPIANHRPDGVIESRSQIVDGIPDDEREREWRGSIGFDADNFIAVVTHDGDDFDGFARQVGVDLPVKVIDVMFGPLNL